MQLECSVFLIQEKKMGRKGGYMFLDNSIMSRVTFGVVVFIFSTFAQSASWILPPGDVDLFGQIKTIPANRDETLLDVARRFGIGQDEMMLANPTVDRWLPEEGAEIVLPKRYIIPQGDRTGFIINLPEMRLYYFPKPNKGKKPVVITHPISIGRMDWRTPLGKTSVVRKQKDPTWIPPQSIKDEAIAAGDPPPPPIVLPGPNNPLGRHAIYLGTAGYLIHGTDKPFGIGMRVTHGCLRMYPEDIEALFDKVTVGTPVQLLNQPIKIGWLADSLFVELHPPLDEDEAEYVDYGQKVRDVIASFIEKTSTGKNANHTRKNIEIDQSALELAIFERNGVPMLISK